MEKEITQMLWSRLDRMEDKLDSLMTFKWKIIGGIVLASMLLTAGFQFALIFMQHKL